MTYYILGRWMWHAPGNAPAMWRPPLPDWQASIDMRSAAECEIAGAADGQFGGYGIFAYPAVVSGPDVTVLTDDPYGDVGASGIAALEAAFQTTLLRPQLSDILIDLHLEMDNIDVTGATKRRPIMPTDRNMAELYLGGLIRQDETGPGDVYWDVVQSQYQYDFAQRRAYDEPRGLVAHRKMLGAWMRQWKVDDPGIFQPPGGVVVEPLEPNTTVTDSFNRSDNTDLNASSTGKSPNFSWNELVGNWSVSSNQLTHVAAGGFASYYLRADTDLSSSDNYAQIKLNNLGAATGNALHGVGSRYSSAANTYYQFIWNGYGGPACFFMSKVVGGSGTQIGTNGGTTRADGDTMKINASGSSITGYRNGAANIGPVTDTAITSGLRGGVVGWSETAGQFDDFEMADLGGAAAAAQQSLSLLGVGD